jgi:predicted RNase H-like HicB family nuclease
MGRYGIVIEGGDGEGYSAYVPDLPGCVAAARTLAGVRKLIAEAIGCHIAMMREEGLEVPPPTSICETAALVRNGATGQNSGTRGRGLASSQARGLGRALPSVSSGIVKKAKKVK